MILPTDWATLGARILAAARQATVIHMDRAAKVLDDSGVAMIVTELDSAEPKA